MSEVLYTTEPLPRTRPRYFRFTRQMLDNIEAHHRAVEERESARLGFPVKWSFWSTGLYRADTGELVGYAL